MSEFDLFNLSLEDFQTKDEVTPKKRENVTE